MASKASAQPEPTAATTTPAAAAPTIRVMLLDRRRSAFASCSRLSLTTCGVSPAAAGQKKASAEPRTA